jgi:uncharacterized ubiquitin-like protein YukD
MTEIKLFKFDYKTDYLPYYKTYKLKIPKNTTVDKLLLQVNEVEKFSYLPDEEFFLKINGIFTSSKADIANFLRDSSQELLIEPISISRAKYDLIIDIEDYKTKLFALSNFISDDKLSQFIAQKKYMLEYYASNSLQINRDYIGDHVLLLAAEIIKEQPQQRNAIFEKISHNEDGLENHTSLQYRVLNYEKAQSNIHQLQRDYFKQVNKVYMYPQYKQYKINFDVKQYFDNFNISLYSSLNNAAFEDIIAISRANYVELASKHHELPLNTTNKKLIHLIAGHILLEATDNNADFLIVNNKEELAIFDKEQKNIDKATGREINLPVLTQEEFLKVMQGEKDKKELGFDTHKINITFLD